MRILQPTLCHSSCASCGFVRERMTFVSCPAKILRQGRHELRPPAPRYIPPGKLWQTRGRLALRVGLYESSGKAPGHRDQHKRPTHSMGLTAWTGASFEAVRSLHIIHQIHISYVLSPLYRPPKRPAILPSHALYPSHIIYTTPHPSISTSSACYCAAACTQ